MNEEDIREIIIGALNAYECPDGDRVEAFQFGTFIGLKHEYSPRTAYEGRDWIIRVEEA